MNRSETNSFNTFNARCYFLFLFCFLPFVSSALAFGPVNVWMRMFLIQTKPFYIQNTSKRYWTMNTQKNQSMFGVCARTLQREFIETGSLNARSHLTLFEVNLCSCTTHSFMVEKQVIQYLAWNSNGDTHQTSCFSSLVLTFCMRSFIHIARWTVLSCLLPKCADNTYKKYRLSRSLCTPIFWPVACYLVSFLSSIFFSFSLPFAFDENIGFDHAHDFHVQM